MATKLMEIKGTNGQITLFDDKVMITRKGILALLTQGLKGTKEIPLSQITAVQFKECGPIASGYLQLSILGGVESKAGIFGATQYENTVMFTTGKLSGLDRLNSEWRKLKEEIMARAEAARSAAVSTHPNSELDDLEKLATLRAKGIVTEDEFQAKKKKLLGL